MQVPPRCSNWPDPDTRQPGGAPDHLAIAAFVLLLVKFTRGFISNISVLLGMASGCAVAIAMGKMNFDKVGKAQ